MPSTSPAAFASKRAALAAGLAALALSIGLYAPSLGAGFVAEDFESLTYRWPAVAAEATTAGGLAGLRPGIAAFFAVLAPIFGRSPEGYRLVILGLHAFAGYAVFQLATRTTGSRLAAAFAAVLFLGAPVHPEAVVWLASAAGTVVSGALTLAVCLLWSRASAPSDRAQWLAGFLTTCALAFKETALPITGLLFALDLGRGRWRAAAGGARSTAPRLRELLHRYRGPLIGTAVYLLALLVTGSWRSLVDYAAGERLGLRHHLVIWSAYAHDLLRPLVGDKPWSITPPYRDPGALEAGTLVVAVLIVVALGRRWWAALWTALALIPGLAAYGERLTYLAVAGSGLIAAELVVRLAGVLERHRIRPTRAQRRAIAALAILALLAADRRALANELRNWNAAGEFAARIPREVKILLPSVPRGSEFYFKGLIDNFEGAYSLRMGVQAEMRRIYDDPTVRAFIVADRRPRGRRILPGQIPCDERQARYFFLYDRPLDRLLRAEPEMLGAECPAPEPEPGSGSSDPALAPR